MSEPSPLRLVPLGGLGEFGLNCMVVERGDEAIAIDCGLMFPEDHMMGVDLVIPDVSYLVSLGERFKGFVLTHAHEDHLGALPYVLPELGVPVFATPFAGGLLAGKLEEHPRARGAVIEKYKPGASFEVAGFEIESLPMTHSTVEACSLAIRSAGDTIVHSGDFKIDPHPIDGRCCSLERLREIGDEGVRVLLSDSTNIEQRGSTGSESEVRGYLRPFFESTTGRLFVTTFASHIHRAATVVSLCEEFGRRLAIVGRSMETIYSLATRSRHLRIPGEMLVSARDAATLPREQICYLVTGSQGEARSALSRIAMLEARDVQPEPGDTVVFSSKMIPGNERPINAVINQLYRCGVEVYYPGIANVHVSGHAYRDELRQMLELVRPEYFVPIHGEYKNLVHHGRLAQETGVPEENCFRLADGDVLELDGQGCRAAGTVAAGRVLVDGMIVGGIDEQIIRDRRHISKDGVVLVILGVSQQTGEIISGPEFVARGLVDSGRERVDYDGARDAVVEHVARMSRAAVRDLDELQEEVRLAARRYFRRTLGSRPVVVPYITEL